MTNAESRDWTMGDASNAATDCRDAAAYAEHAFRRCDEQKGREYVALLEQRLGMLKAHLSSLDYNNAQIAKFGADAAVGSGSQL
jgi:hypothetical protein